MPVITSQGNAARSQRQCEALQRLFEVCIGMDGDRASKTRPTERQYRSAMNQAARALGQPAPTWPTTKE